jgi:hypothetical protein
MEIRNWVMQVLIHGNPKLKPVYELAHLDEAVAPLFAAPLDAAPLFESLLTYSLQAPPSQPNAQLAKGFREICEGYCSLPPLPTKPSSTTAHLSRQGAYSTTSLPATSLLATSLPACSTTSLSHFFKNSMNTNPCLQSPECVLDFNNITGQSLAKTTPSRNPHKASQDCGGSDRLRERM